MQKDEAIKILARHLMQCGMMMPIEWVQKNGGGSEFMQAYEMALNALKNEPVRCKDCRDCEMCYPEKRLDKEATQAWLCNRYKRFTKPDDFCSYGERRNDG